MSPTFKRKLLPPSSGQKSNSSLKKQYYHRVGQDWRAEQLGEILVKCLLRTSITLVIIH
jgi:hypothetical protein